MVISDKKLLFFNKELWKNTYTRLWLTRHGEDTYLSRHTIVKWVDYVAGEVATSTRMPAGAEMLDNISDGIMRVVIGADTGDPSDPKSGHTILKFYNPVVKSRWISDITIGCIEDQGAILLETIYECEKIGTVVDSSLSDSGEYHIQIEHQQGGST